MPTPQEKAAAWKPIDVFEDVVRTMLVCGNGCVTCDELESCWGQLRAWFDKAYLDGYRTGVNDAGGTMPGESK